MINLDEVRTVLRGVLDPEIHVNVIDLGLIYDIHEEGNGQVDITMTLTTPDCPLLEGFMDQIEGAVAHVDGVAAVDVHLVFDPPWTPDKMNPETRQALGIQ